MIGYGWHGGGGGWGAWVFMAVMLAVVCVAIIAAAVMLVRYRTDQHSPTTPTRTPTGDRDSALQILDERFARGEIDAEEYTHRRDLLRS